MKAPLLLSPEWMNDFCQILSRHTSASYSWPQIHIFNTTLDVRYVVRFSCSPTSTDLVYATKLVRCISKSTMKHMQKPDCKSDPPWSSYGYREVHVCWFLNRIHRSSQSCSLLSEESFLTFVDAWPHWTWKLGGEWAHLWHSQSCKYIKTHSTNACMKSIDPSFSLPKRAFLRNYCNCILEYQLWT